VPVIFRHDGFTFFFFSDGASRANQRMFTFAKDRGSAKFWLTPEARVARSDG
jgi:hypothetical protein